MLVGIAVVLAGVEQHRSGAFSAFVLIVVVVLIGLRRLRRVAPAFPG